MVLSSKLDFNLALETANSNFLENIFCAIETNVDTHLKLEQILQVAITIKDRAPNDFSHRQPMFFHPVWPHQPPTLKNFYLLQKEIHQQ